MISFEEATHIVAHHVPESEVVFAPPLQSLGCVLAQAIVAREHHPTFDSSAVDGFAVRLADVVSGGTPVELPILATVRAGDAPGRMSDKRGAVRMMTGAPIPYGVDAVIMREDVREHPDRVVLNRAVKDGENIRYAGEELRQNQTVLESGTTVTPAAAALLASLGYTTVPVYASPSVAVVTTGDELVDVGSTINAGKVRDANSVFLQAALQGVGIHNTVLKLRVKDNVDSLRSALAHALDTSTVILVSGGVSVGDYDYVKSVLQDLGVTCRFWRIAVKPGKPTYFGTKGNSLVFGLPGNPVAVGVIFYELVYPTLRKLRHHSQTMLVEMTAELAGSFRSSTSRLEFVRGYVYQRNRNSYVAPLRQQGSHMISGFTAANCLIPVEGRDLERGQKVHVHLLPWVSIQDSSTWREQEGHYEPETIRESYGDLYQQEEGGPKDECPVGPAP